MALQNSAITGNENGGIIAKLAKINELRKGATTQAEAETAAALLQKLLIQHKLELTDIEAVELNRDEPVIRRFGWKHNPETPGEFPVTVVVQFPGNRTIHGNIATYRLERIGFDGKITW